MAAYCIVLMPFWDLNVPCLSLVSPAGSRCADAHVALQVVPLWGSEPAMQRGRCTCAGAVRYDTQQRKGTDSLRHPRGETGASSTGSPTRTLGCG